MQRSPIFAACSLLTAGLCAASSAWAITSTELAARLQANDRMLVVDVRSATAFGEGHIPGAINIPLSLLPYKPLPTGQPIVVYGDGLGVVDDAAALTAAKAKPGANADVLQGGYAAWLSQTRLSTGAAGVNRERIPGITYQQLVAAGKSDVVLVDLRGSSNAAAASTPATAQARAKGAAPAKAASQVDVVKNFASKLGVPIVAADAVSGGAAGARSTAASGVKAAGAPARAAAAMPSDGTKLLVLVADNEAEANEVARQLRARGNYRFTVLIGGTDIIRHEGRLGTGRMDGDLPAVKSQP